MAFQLINDNIFLGVDYVVRNTNKGFRTSADIVAPDKPVYPRNLILDLYCLIIRK